MTKQIKADLDKVVEAVMDQLVQKESMFNYDVFKLHIRTALEQFVVEENTKTLLDQVREVMAQKDKSHSQITDEIIKIIENYESYN